METLQGLKRTHYCGELTEQNIGQTVTVMGWVDVYRNLGSLIFIDLRDRSGIIQLSFDTEIDKEVFKKAATVRNEYVLAAVGEVVERSAPNPKIKTGMIEIKVSELRILSKAETPPFSVAEDNTEVKEELRLKYRYLDLRRPSMQKNLMLRHKIAKVVRDFFDENGFLEIETPMLTRSTPEGARDYLVPSRVHPGSFYALPQSPQLYKQLLMLSGFDRYVQIVKCFRDEDLRADRQPEFTQIDLEMSFVEMGDVIDINEKMVARVFYEVLGKKIKTPFRRITYTEAMERFGSDKPDTRFGLELKDITDIVKNSGFGVFANAVKDGGSVRAIVVPGSVGKLTRKDLDALGEFVKTYRAKGLAWMVREQDSIRSPIAKFFSEDELDAICAATEAKVGDTLLFVADKDSIVFDSLGALRLELAKKFDLIQKNTYDLLWVTEFPLLEYDEQEKRFVAKHHPFTAPMDEDLQYLDTDPGRVRSKAYDIILNGCELGGGSIRIFNTELQQKMLEVLGFSRDEAWQRFGFLLEAFKYGVPPHGGMAYGLDRFAMLLAGCSSIRDVIAFPKLQNASELMTNAPDAVDEKQLAEISIKLDIDKK